MVPAVIILSCWDSYEYILLNLRRSPTPTYPQIIFLFLGEIISMVPQQSTSP